MADIQSIYDRLHANTSYRPLSAETFGDWSLEAGDIVSVAKGGTAYQTPVLSNRIKWNGASKAIIESEGKKKRDPLSVVSKRAYSGRSGGGGYYNEEKLYTFEVNQEHLLYDVYNEEGDLHSRFEIMAGQIQSEVDARTAQGETFDTRITETAREITLEAAARDASEKEIKSSISVQADKIALVVDGGNNIKPAAIVAAINNGDSSIVISADHVDVDGILTAKRLETALGKISRLSISGTSNFDGRATFQRGLVSYGVTTLQTVYVDDYKASWQDQQVVTSVTTMGAQYIACCSSSARTTVSSSYLGNIVTAVSRTTIHYLGR